ncbi:hypothetical protein KJ656_13255, partial [bacterium]|nr:hypothetical protein [bacterium]
MKWILLNCLLLSNTGLFAADMSGLNASLGSYDPSGAFSITENVFMIVKDSMGRETGYNPFTNSWKRDIPSSGSGSDSIGDNETGDPGPADFTIDITENLIQEKYNFEIFGLCDVRYIFEINADKSNGGSIHFEFKDYITSGTVRNYALQFDPTPGSPAPTIIKEVTFQLLRDDVLVAQKLNQIGDDKFVDSLIKQIILAE